ncbi:MAG: glycoside hydrolase family 5 protein [Treponema sp.]|nr:glycoside hydrolase family 5 protein [Treponema sp.]MCL2251944.1 glycoside hydrolase family 5 protein [Treponema sp.]
MKIKVIVLYLLTVFFVTCNSVQTTINEYDESENTEIAAKSAPFSKGVNFSDWFETFSAGSIPFTKYNEQDFANVKSIGADVIRLPIRMHSMTKGEPDYIFDPLLFKFLDKAVDWAEKYQLYLIIDNHSFDPVRPTSNDIDKILIPVWEQIANRYKDRSNYILYEILNEPHGISDARWGEIQGKAIDAIRRIDQKHTIIVGGTDYNSIGKLFSIPKYKDTNLIYTFHFYDPHIFTHQGANWGEPSLVSLKNIPFPYDSSRMPRTPVNLLNTWIPSAMNNYRYASSPKNLYAPLDRAVKFSIERDVPIFCGEFGVYMINSLNDDRIRWYEIVTAALDRRNISRTSWDYYGGFGLFNTGRGGSFNHDLNTKLVSALGFSPPMQSKKIERSINNGFIIYDDYPNHQYVNASFWGENTDFSLYDTNTDKGEFAIRWGNASQYNVFSFEFLPSNINLEYLVQNGYFLEFNARTNHPVSFDVRFVNSENETSVPWRMRYTITEKELKPDGEWYTIGILLSAMNEHGAWNTKTQKWLSPKGDFTWASVNQLQFVAEHSDLTNTIWFDEIRITK